MIVDWAKEAKGAKKCIIKRRLKFEDYKSFTKYSLVL